jgi:hypothetical protein
VICAKCGKGYEGEQAAQKMTWLDGTTYYFHMRRDECKPPIAAGFPLELFTTEGAPKVHGVQVCPHCKCSWALLGDTIKFKTLCHNCGRPIAQKDQVVGEECHD